jgi:ATP phosphoribosyltransferase regulatory subunit
MNTKLIHTPEGVRDIYGDEYAEKLRVQELLRKRISLYGYQDIQTPTFEFLDVFGEEIGTTPVRELFKFFDSDGNILCLRPDFTPSMARLAAKYFSHEPLPLRFSYLGNTFSNTSLLQGKLKETTQMGAELMGDDSVEADGEIISMLVDALLHTGLKEFQVSIGEIDFFRGMCEELSLTLEQERIIRDYISNKNFFAVKEYLLSEQVEESAIENIMQIEELFGSVDMLKRALDITDNPLCQKAISRLTALHDILTAYGVADYVNYDLGMLSSYRYYTGIIFKVYTHGIGNVVVKGGRYDKLLPYFGKNSPAIGFVIVVDDLMQALNRQKITIDLPDNGLLLVYDQKKFKEALSKAKQYRAENRQVQMMVRREGLSGEDYERYARNNRISQVIFFQD